MPPKPAMVEMLPHWEEQLEAFERDARKTVTQRQAELLCAAFGRFKRRHPDTCIQVRMAIRFARALDTERFRVK